MYKRERSNKIVLLLNILSLGNMEQIFFQLEFSPYITILGSEYYHFYTDMCTQSSETAHYLCPRRRMGDSDE
jgi:hypothetical protein